MNVSLETWVITAVILTAILIADIFFQVKRKSEPSFKESAIISTVFILLAVAFAPLVGAVWGSEFGEQYIAGFVTEKSLSVDNLFVFLIIFTKLSVPKKAQSQALIVGIMIALVLRFIFIAVGAAAISAFSWVFYIFGAFLIYTAINLVKEHFSSHDSDDAPGGKLIIKDGKRFYTPLLFAMIAIGSADILFALDSIPAVFGLTSEPYIVFTANAFALLGLRHLYFLLSGLLLRLKYLGLGLSVILGWIGIKLAIHALHKNELPFINGGEHVDWLPEISTELSLGVILGTITIATVASLIATREKKNAKAE
ncbi:MAG: TerC family protein [Microbacteriaceae bacterium]|nr:TerC family protein [Microbacteriaceae bacterium]